MFWGFFLGPGGFVQGGGLGLERNECNVLSVVECIGMDGECYDVQGALHRLLSFYRTAYR